LEVVARGVLGLLREITHDPAQHTQTYNFLLKHILSSGNFDCLRERYRLFSFLRCGGCERC
jgi:hypothetical protein